MPHDLGALAPCHPLPTRRAFAALCSFALLAACSGGGGGSGSGGGGGGGGGGPATFSISTHSITFSSTAPVGPAPPSATVTGMVTGSLSGGVLYIVVDVSGNAVASVSNFAVSGNSGQATVVPQLPSTLGVGNFTSTLTVHACLGDATCATGELSGSPQLINVSYTIAGTTLADTAMPHTIPASASGSIVLRGGGFTGTSAVMLGSTAATSFTLVSDSMIRATYPAGLAAGLQTITLTGSQTPFSAQVFVAGSEAFAPTTLSYINTPQRIAALLFDAQREVLYVAADFSPNSAANQIWVYTYSGGAWGMPAVIAVPDLVDLTLSADGSRVIALTATSVEEFDAANPTGGAVATITPSFTATGPQLLHLALANNGNALLATGTYGSNTISDAYVFSLAASTFSDLGDTYQLETYADTSGASLAASGDGSLILAIQGAALPPSPLAFTYSAASGIVSPFTVPFNQTGPMSQLNYEPPALDTAGDRIVLTDGNFSWVSGGSSNTLGALTPTTAPTQIRVEVLNPAGTRAYEVHGDGTLHTFDLTAALVGGAYPEIGAPVAVTIPSNSSISLELHTALTPDGASLFIAGNTGVVVMAAPQ